jgi:DNA-binding response OmpR family regulator
MASVLVIDDEPLIRDMIRDFFEAEGHQVSTAEDGHAGLVAFQELRPEVVIVDLFMPEKEGLETIQEIARHDPTVRIVAISGGGRFGLNFLEAARGFGASSVVRKPFRMDELLQAAQL